MGLVAHVVTPGAVLAVAAATSACVAVAVVLLTRRARSRRAAQDAALARSRAEVEELSRRLDALAHEVERSQRTADLDREYVITSLGAGEPPDTVDHRPRTGAVAAPGEDQQRPLSSVLEDQLVDALARTPRGSALQSWGVEVVVRAVALGHGVRRALSGDVLDRAAAEAHVARRRSRRARRRELRDARRAVAADRQRGPSDAAGGRTPGREVA